MDSVHRAPAREAGYELGAGHLVGWLIGFATVGLGFFLGFSPRPEALICAMALGYATPFALGAIREPWKPVASEGISLPHVPPLILWLLVYAALMVGLLRT